jgi:CheY-like chemotaxis protein
MNSILIADDNAAVRMVLADILQLLFPQTRVLQAEDGAECVAIARNQAPDLILMDAEMPAMNGFEAAQILRQETPTRHILIVAISSAAQDNKIASGLRNVSDASLPKPFTAAELLQTMQRVMRFAGAMV